MLCRVGYGVGLCSEMFNGDIISLYTAISSSLHLFVFLLLDLDPGLFISLLRSLSVPKKSLGHVFPHAYPILVNFTEGILSVYVSLFSRILKMAEGFGKVSSNSRTLVIPDTGFELFFRFLLPHKLVRFKKVF